MIIAKWSCWQVGGGVMRISVSSSKSSPILMWWHWGQEPAHSLPSDWSSAPAVARSHWSSWTGRVPAECSKHWLAMGDWPEWTRGKPGRGGLLCTTRQSSPSKDRTGANACHAHTQATRDAEANTIVQDVKLKVGGCPPGPASVPDSFPFH